MIRTRRLLLRTWRQDDREPFAAINADPRVAEFLPAVLTRQESDAFLDRIDELGLDEIVSFTVPDNWPSRRVMERLGMSHDAADDFDHPLLPAGHPLRRHALYRIRASGGSHG